MLYQYNESVGKIVMKIRLKIKKIYVNLKLIKVINNCIDGCELIGFLELL